MFFHSIKFRMLLLLSWSILILVLITAPMPSSEGGEVTYYDKIAHAILFGMFSYLFVYVFVDIEKIILRKLIVLSLIVSILFAGLGEYIQSFLPSRTVSEYDFAAGLIGVVVFLFFTYEKYKR